ncbi:MULTISPECIES: helix-turn-helix domain-containing protein [unclassified Oceanispirochaeta]|nr:MULTISPECIES: AraC family transcriptional regulator [unclassified Oceanispirochaeta]MBF9018926.1 helix-turn-helix transcriptional regulator [Oceanispirochaeta sp. M2]NPD75425.1 helix-turn-helix transcriptional regulator [Oceanispirochaeta sp. M1]RDG28725.1 AraC family transcriptional regulator [Oceanispirochaeta sp. M1]
MIKDRKYLQPDLKLLDMSIIKELGINSSRTARNLPWHKNKGFELTYAYSGEFIWEIRNETEIQWLRLCGGDLGLTPPEVTHRGYDSLIGPGELLYIVFDLESDGAETCTGMTSEELTEFNRLWKKIDKGTVSIDSRTRSYCVDLAVLLKDSGRSKTILFIQHEMRLLILQILIGSLSCFMNPQKQDESSPIKRACLFMEEHINKNLKIDQIADSSGLGKTRFYELFLKEKGLPPGDYFNQLRCQRACALLRETEKSITEIAFDCSYSSSQYFSSCIRKYTGCSPTEYREKHRLNYGSF